MMFEQNCVCKICGDGFVSPVTVNCEREKIYCDDCRGVIAKSEVNEVVEKMAKFAKDTGVTFVHSSDELFYMNTEDFGLLSHAYTFVGKATIGMWFSEEGEIYMTENQWDYLCSKGSDKALKLVESIQQFNGSNMPTLLFGTPKKCDSEPVKETPKETPTVNNEQVIVNSENEQDDEIIPLSTETLSQSNNTPNDTKYDNLPCVMCGHSTGKGKLFKDSAAICRYCLPFVKAGVRVNKEIRAHVTSLHSKDYILREYFKKYGALDTEK